VTRHEFFLFPAIPTTADGSQAGVWLEIHITQGASANPITPSTNLDGGYQLAVANGLRNLWGEPLATLLQTEEDRLRNWRMLQEMAELR
jgi:hypothetical protein